MSVLQKVKKALEVGMKTITLPEQEFKEFCMEPEVCQQYFFGKNDMLMTLIAKAALTGRQQCVEYIREGKSCVVIRGE